VTAEERTLWTGVGVLVSGQIIQRLDAWRVARKTKELAEAAARKIKADLDEASANYLLKLEVIRIEGNSKMSAQKKKTWDLALALAHATRDNDHMAQARLAEKEYLDHQEAQALADERVRVYVEAQKLKILENAVNL